MHTQQLSVYELKQYWKEVDNLVEGGSIVCPPLHLMPLWDDICSELSWELHLVEGGYFGRKHHGYCGVYRLIGLASEGDLSKPVTLNRVGGQDTSGTLYIGEARSLSTRLNQLRRSSLRRERSHNAIAMLRRIPLLKFPSNKLAIALLFTGTSTRCVESSLIEAYMNSFGDTPPLNYKL